jgi:hypothetical protein
MSARETPCFAAMTRANLVTRTSLPRPAVRRICRWMSTRTRWINMAAPHWPERCCRSQVRCSWRTVALFGSSGPCHCLRRPCGQFSTGDCVDAGNSKPILPTLRKHRRPPSYVRVLPSGSPAGPTFRSCGRLRQRQGPAQRQARGGVSSHRQKEVRYFGCKQPIPAKQRFRSGRRQSRPRAGQRSGSGG